MQNQFPSSDAEEDPQAIRAELAAILDRFNLSIEEFDRKRNDCLEKQFARSPRELKKLYLLLLKPGLTIGQIVKKCSPWPAGHHRAGCKPNRTALRAIKKRLLAAGNIALELKLKKENLRLRERQVTARENQLDLDQKKFQHKLHSTPPAPETGDLATDEPYDVEAEKQKTRAMTEKIYGKDIFTDYENS